MQSINASTYQLSERADAELHFVTVPNLFLRHELRA
jgi:hypothetical protein